jgi:hypothetical protein
MRSRRTSGSARGPSCIVPRNRSPYSEISKVALRGRRRPPAKMTRSLGVLVLRRQRALPTRRHRSSAWASFSPWPSSYSSGRLSFPNVQRGKPSQPSVYAKRFSITCSSMWRLRSGGKVGIASLQGTYFLATGFWPLVSRRTFERVTGPKVDFWLARTVGVLVASIGATMLVGARRRKIDPELELLALSSAAGLAAIDLIFSLRGRISKIYLLDAAVESAIVASWALRRLPSGLDTRPLARELDLQAATVERLPS